MSAAHRPRDKEEGETTLEYNLDILIPLPPLVKRMLDHVGDLDRKAVKIQKTLEEGEEEYLDKAIRRIREFPLPQVDPSAHCAAIPVPTTEELRAVIAIPALTDQITVDRDTLLKICAEKVETSTRVCELIAENLSRVESELQRFETALKESGGFEAKGAQPGDLVAINVTQTKEDILNLDDAGGDGSAEWILGKVLSYDAEQQTYVIQDEDVESQTKVYNLRDSAIMQLGNFEKLSKGDRVYAVYPDTTSFYQATVVTVRKSHNHSSAQGVGGVANLNNTHGLGSVVYVNFMDDHDDLGVTHDKPVLMTHVMKM